MRTAFFEINDRDVKKGAFLWGGQNGDSLSFRIVRSPSSLRLIKVHRAVFGLHLKLFEAWGRCHYCCDYTELEERTRPILLAIDGFAQTWEGNAAR